MIVGIALRVLIVDGAVQVGVDVLSRMCGRGGAVEGEDLGDEDPADWAGIGVVAAVESTNTPVMERHCTVSRGR